MLDRALRRPVVMVYHGVNDTADEDDPNQIVVPPRHFRAHVELLRRRGYRFLSVEGLLDRGASEPPPPRTAVLTFDDGWRDGLTVVAPLLGRLEIPATFYVCPGQWAAQHVDVTGPAGRLLDEREAHSLVQAGMELGSHTMSHPDLRLLDDDALAAELSDSKAAIERLTGRPCRTLAYPFGLFDERVQAAVAHAGYELALAWQPGPWHRLAVPRLPGPPRHGARRLALKLLGLSRRES